VKPYYDEHGITIYHGDCREVLPTLPKGSVHLIVTDPPYGVRWQSHGRAERFAFIVGDEDQTAAEIGLALALAALKDGRHVYAFGRYDLSALPLGASAELIWDKGSASHNGAAMLWARHHEYIQFAEYRSSAAHRERMRGQKAARIRQGSVLRYASLDGSVLRHPTQKPVALLRELIEMSSRFGETVLDPFAGVGSTLVAAQLEGRRAIGIEIEERYCEIAAERLRQSVFAFDEVPA
jgi:DNA modification methylase